MTSEEKDWENGILRGIGRGIQIFLQSGEDSATLSVDVEAAKMLAAALREYVKNSDKTPDPETGLVPCGCGGKAHIINSSGYSRRLYVECDRCAIMLGVEATGDGALQGIYRYDDQIIKDWNQAMGWKGDAE